MGTLIQDVRYALRQLAKHPGFTAVAVLTLALGIGANTAIFSVVDGVLLRPAPFRESDRLMMVWETDRHSGTSHEPSAIPDFLDFQDRSGAFRTLTAFMPTETTLSPDDGRAVRLATLVVSHEFLPMVGVGPLAGRVFTAEDDAEGGAPVAMIGERLWERLFSRDPDIVGRTLRIDDRPVTVIGVLPANADFGALQILESADYQRSFADRFGGTDVELWVPLRPSRQASRDTHPIFVMGRLAPGATRATAQEEMAAIMADLEAAYPSNDARGAFVQPLSDVVFGTVRPALIVLLAAVMLVLLVACVNVANLLLARGTTRVRDVAVRTALGASARRIGRQFFVEGFVLSVLGAAVGVVLAVWGTQVLLSLAPASIPRLASVGVNARVLGATLLVSAVVGVAFGMVPTFQARRLDLQTSLKGESTGSVATGTTHARVRSALVVAELALAVTLVVGAGLLIKSFWRLQRVDPGFQAHGVLKAEYQLPASRYPVDFSVWPDFKEMHRFDGALLDAVRRIPGVRGAAIAGNSPMDAGFTNSFVVVGREAEARDWPEISVRRVTPGYFTTVGLVVEHGRAFDESDRTRGPFVSMINEAAAERFFPNQEALGRQIRMWGADRTIVGIVANEKFHGLVGGDPIGLYLPLAQAPSVDGAETLLLRTAGDPASLAAAARKAVLSVDPGLAVFGIEPLTTTVARSLGQRRFTVLLLSAFAAVAIVLALIGVHGVLSYMVARRSRELGLRVALGASRASVVGMVLRQGVALAVIGLAMGLAGAAAGAGLLRKLLYGVSQTDPLTYVAVSAVVLGVALFASYLPARRATRVHPMEALRYE
jgi:putative ABC transport system permease protein